MHHRHLHSLALLVPMWLLAAPAARAAEPAVDANTLLKDSDRARGAVAEGVSWEIDVKTLEDGDTNEVHYRVKVKGVDALAEALKPARNKGETMLFNDRNLWFFKPGMKKPAVDFGAAKAAGPGCQRRHRLNQLRPRLHRHPRRRRKGRRRGLL